MTLVRGDLKKLVNEFESFVKEEGKKPSVIGLCGGRSIVPFLEPLTSINISEGFRFFFVDERLVPIDHDLSNYKGLKVPFFDRVAHAEVFPFYYYEGVDMKSLLAEYQESFDHEGGRFDIVVLGAGEDGHVASLFPHQSVNTKEKGFFYVHDSPKDPKDRVSISPTQIEQARRAVVLFMGEGKKEALANFLDPTKTVNDCPAKLALSAGEVLVLTDIQE
jgi:6-phosphogluconolactonase